MRLIKRFWDRGMGGSEALKAIGVDLKSLLRL